MGNFGAAPLGRPEMAFNAFNMAFNAGGRICGTAGFAGQPLSMKRILRGSRFCWRPFFYNARGGGAARPIRREIFVGEKRMVPHSAPCGRPKLVSAGLFGWPGCAWVPAALVWCKKAKKRTILV